MAILGTKIAVVDFYMPIETDKEFQDIWLPDILKSEKVIVNHVALWKTFPKPNENIGIYIAFISTEDASYLMIKHPEIRDSIHRWPPLAGDKLFNDFDK